MTASRIRGGGLAVVAVAGLIAGCSSGNSGSNAGPSGATTVPYADCNPITVAQLTQTLNATTLTAHSHPPVCAWAAARGTEDSDVTFTAVQKQSLQQAWNLADKDGNRLEHLTIEQDVLGTKTTAAGFYIHNTKDPGDCAVVASDNGTSLTWRIQNHSHTAALDPCATAYALAELTVDLSP
ncbi:MULTISPECIES: DUF3558 family protein [unclassified Nocardia]|uniref:DUF3558 family protein n=1 Tax=unclassified Nocardia TaxID=2637762 RepID=UPI001CE41B97|nr:MULTISPECIES: DUF3558 family protein [unclassified Nocardia]